ncbi:Dipeptidyl aminopeptidase/acylaminoacyl-peptidase-like [Hymenobacter roseosalivarius DSM 11622]|uniref:Dipeptidyl aminopeptidase/acylaminoacyl-peptidase-like n=2 Tax=Hymenobacter roseosalivarius TaxID=89967 RepID=A0A1W1VED2_9BACT|nr:Dipeptidyl aminopeptidase/acylaminoacyl-peptidase-like [Hymenobacter roseosalivarius DSM 11622]
MPPSLSPTAVEFLLTCARHTRPFAADAHFLPDGQAKPVIIFVHGFKGFKDWGHFNVLADYVARQGFVFVKLNLSHNGIVPGGTGDLEDMEAFGNNNFSLELDDLGALLDSLYWPGKAAIPPAEMDLSRLFLVGHSRGGGLAMLKAAEDARVRAVAAWAPISDIDQRWSAEVMQRWQAEGVQYIDNTRTGQRMPLYYQLAEDFKANKDRLDIPTNVREKLRQPLLILHGDEDETLPVSMAHDLKSWKPDAELVILPGAGHMFGGKHPWKEDQLPTLAQEVADRTIAFFKGIE